MMRVRNGDRQTAVPPVPVVDADLLSSFPAPNSRREFAIGLFAILSAAAVVAVLLMLTDPAVLQGRYVVDTVVEDAGGLRRGDPVHMRGVRIGRVQGFQMGSEGVVVDLALDRGYDIPEDSRVKLRSLSLLGGMTAEIVPGTSPRQVRAGARLAGLTDTGAFGAAAELGSRADTILAQVQMLLSDQTVNAVGQSAAGMQILIRELAGLVAEQRAEMRALSGSLRRSAEGVERATAAPEIERVLARIDSLTVQLGAASASLTRASGSVESSLARFEQGEGTLGRLARDDALYEDLQQTVQNLNRLAEDIRLNPRRYLRVF